MKRASTSDLCLWIHHILVNKKLMGRGMFFITPNIIASLNCCRRILSENFPYFIVLAKVPSKGNDAEHPSFLQRNARLSMQCFAKRWGEWFCDLSF